MRKSLIKLLGVVAALMLSTTVSAVGMGGINVVSALGQPLKADIELVAIGKAEKDSLVARLASPEAYKSAGLEYPYGNKFKFQIESRPNGQQYIKASSAQPVNDPFVSLLIELTWSSGKLSREYTFLLDPPGYVPEQPVKATVQAVAPVVQPAVAVSAVPSAPVEAEAKPAEQAAPAEAAAKPAEHTAPVAAVAKPAEQAAPAEAEAKSVEQTAPVEAVAKPAEQAAPAEAAKPAEQVAPAEAAAKPVEQIAPVEAPAKLEEQAAPTEAPAKVEEQAAPAEAAVKPVEQAAPAATAAAKEWLAVRRGDTMYKIAEQNKQADVSLERMLVAIYRINAEQFEGKNMNRVKVGKILHLPSQQELANVSQPDAEKEIHAQAADWNAYRQKLASAATVSSQSQTVQQVATGKISSSIADMAPVAKESAKEVLKLSKGEAPGDQVGMGAGGKAMSAQDKKNAVQENEIASSKAMKEGQERAALLEKNIKDMQRLAQLKAEAAALAQSSSVAKTPASAVQAASAVVATSAVKAASAVKPTPAVQPKPKQAKPEPSMLDQILEEPLYLAGGAAALLALGGAGFLMWRRRKNNLADVSKGRAPEDIGERTGHLAAPVIASPETGDFTATATTQAMAASESDNVDPISEADLFLNFGRDVQAEEILKEALQNTPENHQIHLKLLGIYANRKDINSFSEIAHQLQDSGDQEAWQQAVAMGHRLEPDNPMYGGAGSLEDTGSATMQIKAFNATSMPDETHKAPASVLDFDLGAGAAEEAPAAKHDFMADAEKTLVMSPDDKHAAQSLEMDFDITATHTPMDTAVEPVAAVPVSEDFDFDITSSHPNMPAADKPEVSKPAQADDDAGMAFTLDFPVETPAESSTSAASSAAAGLADISLNFDGVETPIEPETESKDEHWQEVATKLDLAKAYHEMGDASGAREILEEVLREGDAEQREAAQNIINQLG